jgi:hypothetical protein
MENPKRFRRVTVKRERTLVFRNHDSVRVEWCAECDAEVGMVCINSAARESGVNELAIYRLVEQRALHFIEDAVGGILVCLNSLRRRHFLE